MTLENVKKYFIPNSILDIGSNVGQFYNECKLVFPDAYYFLIEGNYKCEEDIVKLNVDYSISLLSDIEKEVGFYIRIHEEKCTGNSIYREKTSFFNNDQIKIEKRKTTTLSTLLNKQNFDLIKIDVQGSELDIMKGGLEIIKNAKGIILEIPIEEYNENSPTKEEIFKFMYENNFEKVDVLGIILHPINHHLIQEDILFLNKNK